MRFRPDISIIFQAFCHARPTSFQGE